MNNYQEFTSRGLRGGEMRYPEVVRATCHLECWRCLLAVVFISAEIFLYAAPQCGIDGLSDGRHIVSGNDVSQR